MKIPEKIILSRTDGIGDMLLMLPMAGIIKKHFPGVKIAVLGKPYTRSLVNACVHVDEFIEAADFFSGNFSLQGKKRSVFINVRTEKAAARRAKKLQIGTRIGTLSRLYHWFTCNRLVKLSRKNSDLHEAQLNLKLLTPLGITEKYSLTSLASFFGLERLQPLHEKFASLLSDKKYNLIVHPKSEGSSREWPIDHFISLINSLDENKFNVFLSGVEKEKVFIDRIIAGLNRPVISFAGQMPLDQFLSFIKASDGILANATGPLHLGGALGIDAFGLYPPIRPIHPGRWAPLGPRVHVLVLDRDCGDCKGRKDHCHCMVELAPAIVKASIETAAKNKFSLNPGNQ